jgi:hypothetical protein
MIAPEYNIVTGAQIVWGDFGLNKAPTVQGRKRARQLTAWDKRERARASEGREL